MRILWTVFRQQEYHKTSVNLEYAQNRTKCKICNNVSFFSVLELLENFTNHCNTPTKKTQISKSICEYNSRFRETLGLNLHNRD